MAGIAQNRSSRSEVFYKKGVLRNFAKFSGKHLCQSLFLIKVAGLSCNFIKKETVAQVFSCEFCEFYKNTFYVRTPLVVASDKKGKNALILLWSLKSEQKLQKKVSEERVIIKKHENG